LWFWNNRQAILEGRPMEDCKELDVLSVATTVGSLSDAQRLAGLLLQRRLAACVQVESGLESHYRWEGTLCQEPEVRLVIKTLPACRQALEAFLAEHHPYDLPQFLATIAGASPAYAGWVRSEVQIP
jgi:periplasmic divalent cation tolerance protein